MTTPTIKLVEDFVSFVRLFVPVTDEEVKQLLLPILEIREFGKKQFISQAGEVEDYMNFIKKGIVRKYYVHNGEEKITQLSIEGHLICNQESFYTRTPAEHFIETIEPTTLVSMRYMELENLFKFSHNFERVGRLVATYIMVLEEKWQMSLIRQTPRERFLSFFESYPEIIQRVPQKYLASFLNIKPETFSRFKHLIRNQRPEVIRYD